VPTTTISSATNAGAGLYVLTFNNAINVTGSGFIESGILLHSPGSDDWTNVTIITPNGSGVTALTVAENNGDTDCDLAVLLGPLSTIGHGTSPAFGFAAPQVPV